MRRETLVLLLVAGLLPLLFFGAAPIPQPAGYHDLADQRPILGIGHFWNVVSNLPFLIFGLMGLQLLRRRQEEAGAAWAALFAGSVLVAFGSAWYHANPNDTTLIWDRLPIGIAFMGFFTALLIEHLDGSARRIARGLLGPLVVISAAAIWWWHASGDLSLWVWVQAAPMLALVLFLVWLPGRYSHRRYLAYALACYAAAKLFELADLELMQWTAGAMSGHTLKHFAAAAGVWCFYVMLRDRSPIREISPTGEGASLPARAAPEGRTTRPGSRR
jgi:hypothetical protein